VQVSQEGDSEVRHTVEDTTEVRRLVEYKRWFGRLTVLGIAMLFGIAAQFSQPAAGEAPDFKLVNLDGKDVKLSELLTGGPVILDFWATWCKPCLKAFPGLQEILDKYEDRGLRVVTISVDGPKSRSRVGPLVRSKKYTFEVLLDTQGRIAQKYNAVALPRTHC
jgi:peroxiredoxin